MVSMILAAALAAPPTADPNTADLRCIAIIAMGAGEAGEDKAGQVAAGFMYYLGRIDARTPGFDLEGGLRTLLSSAQQIAGLQADATRCGAELQQRGKDVMVLGQALQAAAKAK